MANLKSVDIDIPNEIAPGVIIQAIEMLPKEKAYVLSFDGKKLAPGSTKEGGDQDLFGNEEGETLAMAKNRLNKEL